MTVQRSWTLDRLVEEYTQHQRRTRGLRPRTYVAVPGSYAYRPGRYAHDAVRRVHRLLTTGHREVVDAISLKPLSPPPWMLQ